MCICFFILGIGSLSLSLVNQEIFGFKIHRNEKYLNLVNQDDWMPLKEKNELVQLYYLGLKKSKQEWTDEFSKQLRFYSLMQLASKVLNNKEVFDFVECGCCLLYTSDAADE